MIRAVLILLLAFIGVWAALLLGGCTSKPVRITGSGVEAPPPIGYIVWCAEQPNDPMCKAKQ